MTISEIDARGKVIRVQEGARLVGRAKVLKVYNQMLQV